MDNSQSSYRSIFKATSLFGGVQVYQILIQIIKSKFIAILLGPAGVGIIGLYQSGLQFVQQLTNMGIAQSAVRDVSEANGTNNALRLGRTIKVVRRLVWFTGILGLIAVAIFSPLLSKSSFGNYDYTIPFIFLSVTLLLDQLSAGQKVILQGMRRLKELSKCSAYGATFGLITSIPLYFIIGVEGIVPSLILNSICMLLLSWLYSNRVKVECVQVTTKQTFEQGKLMLEMGISISVSGILATGAAFIIRGYIQKLDSVDAVGLFQAGYVMMNTYVGLIMNAIVTDYYPRLAAINKDDDKCRETVCQQGEIATMILAPLLTLCLVLMPFVLQLLYSDSFLGANDYVSWACLGMMFRMSSWVVAFLFVAKAESTLYMINELIATIVYTILSIIGYRLWGLQGIGAAFTLHYLLYFLQVYLLAHYRYKFRFTSSFINCFVLQTFIIIICLAVVLLTDGVIKYTVGTLIILTNIAIGVNGLNQRIDLMSVLRHKKHR